MGHEKPNNVVDIKDYLSKEPKTPVGRERGRVAPFESKKKAEPDPEMDAVIGEYPPDDGVVVENTANAGAKELKQAKLVIMDMLRYHGGKMTFVRAKLERTSEPDELKLSITYTLKPDTANGVPITKTTPTILRVS